MIYKIFTDGGSRGNPGPGAIGVVVYDEHHKLITSFGKTIGTVTNNIAEYQAVLAALLWVKKQGIYSLNEVRSFNSSSRPASPSSNNNIIIHFYLDSLLVASQLGGVYKIKEPKLINLFGEIQLLIGELQVSVSFTHIPRAKNKLADLEVNKVLDKEIFFA